MKKRLLSTLLTLCIVLALLPMTAQAAEIAYPVTGGNLYFDTETETITGCDESVVNAIIPSSISGCPVTHVGDSAFNGCQNLTGVTIPNSVTTIGFNAFAFCYNLASVTIPNGVTSIDAQAFIFCDSLTGMTIPDSVTTIGRAAFAECGSLTSVTIPASVTAIGEGVFSGCVSLTDIYVSSGNSAYVSVDGVLFNADRTNLLAYPAGKSASSYTVPESVTRVGFSAFSMCALSNVTIPSSVTSIGTWAFRGCGKLTDVYYGGRERQWTQIDFEDVDPDYGPVYGATIHYNSTGPIPVVKAVLSPQKLTVDGNNITCEKYNIDGSNYFKLRDLAYLLKDTGSRFAVHFNAETSMVIVTSGASYTPAGGELAIGVDNSATAQPSSQSILIDGVKHDELTVYNIGGSNFFQLRELGNILGFEVDYDVSTDTAIVRSK